ncbi:MULTISPECIES: hypothetical protein [unclassified Natrinema]|uniref:hypothetical protein n=1 Tax=unclassified Natrinema TaxID=2622230 RepID=UPI00026D5012|nr:MULTISPECIES: hypothetical protein [unclassified Natrinema]AFO58787.1 hypothetical protein NJ7G_3570 [Natrinema sp. J7-2]
MSALLDALRVTVRSERLGTAVVIVAVLETLVRVGLAVAISPVASLLLPPLIAVVGLASVVPVVRNAMDGSDETPAQNVAVRRRLPSLVGVAVGGHALALAGGAALFLLVDTPIRYGLYWAGRGDLLTLTIIVITPLIGVTVGMLVMWAIPAIAVVRVADGDSWVQGLRTALVTTVTRPRAIGGAICRQLVFVAVFNVAVGVGARIGSELGSGPQFGFIEYMYFPLALVFEGIIDIYSIVFGGLVVVFGGALWLALSLVLTVRSVPVSGESFSGAPIPTKTSVARLALAILLGTALVGAAGAVRMGEVRPMDTSPEPLPDDPDALYATAWENTDRASHEYQLAYLNSDNEITNHLMMRIDRDDRQIVTRMNPQGELTGDESTWYVSTGLASGSRSVSLEEAIFGTRRIDDDQIGRGEHFPSYFYWEEGDIRFNDPPDDATGWTIVNESAETVTLEMTDPKAVSAVLSSSNDWIESEEVDIRESWARMTIDTERNTLSEGEVRLNATKYEDGEATVYDVHTTYQYDVDIEADRPSEFGTPRPEELLWRLFAY